MPNLCNRTSVGVLAVRDSEILAFQRQTFPLALAPCAGHVDELDGIPAGTGAAEELRYADAAVRELAEETGLLVERRDLRPVFGGWMNNPCRRRTLDGGPPRHYWRVYVAPIGVGQEPQGNGRESADLAWYTFAELLAQPDLEQVWRDMLATIGEIR